MCIRDRLEAIEVGPINVEAHRMPRRERARRLRRDAAPHAHRLQVRERLVRGVVDIKHAKQRHRLRADAQVARVELGVVDERLKQPHR
eukprot:4980833-Prymnesium_polylepis.3